MFHSNYKHIINRLPKSLVKRACKRLLYHSKDSVPLESISRKSERIESYLKHTLEVYENSLNRKKSLPTIHVIDSGAQTDNSTWLEALKHDYEEENNRWIMNELKVLSQYLVDYNKRTFGKFIKNIEKDYKEWVTANKKMRYEIKGLKIQLLEEIQDFNREIECLENASEEGISELKSKISSLKNQLYQTKKDVRDKEKYIASLEKRLVEFEEQVEKLRCQIRSISSQKNSPERGNSPDLYNSDNNMATITKLANAIDEQQRCYNAEAERDNKIIRRQNAEGVEQMVIADLYQLRTNAQNQVNRMLDNITGKLYERYEKWKNKTHVECQNNLNLQAQILALQNNSPNQINMVGEHPYFDWDDNIPDFLAQLRLDLQRHGIDPVNNAGGPPIGRDQAIGYLRGCMRGRTLE
ncbi:hypothetical protein RclHR1_20020006 [Rhizophagus clarus]|uniref:Basic leucine zipper domain-containing protein n=1 Tax=Rhizophagus clarus TaxID=94130 RepID=A0A2Z6QSS1_9GLOM|nr:hypothetical protein RclHR1_20020006 [Rhizophagus clarus]